MNFTPNYAEKYRCDNCDFKCSKDSDWNRHILTRKHKFRTNGVFLNADQQPNFICKFCKKKYKMRNSLWYHEKKCDFITTKSNEKINSSNSDIQALTGLIFEMIKSNSELQKNMIEICKQGHNNYTSNINNNCNNTFNLQVFLNETCKNAMNISEFIENISLQLSDLENIGKLGYVEGVSNIIIKNLNALDVTQRPLHCTDKKRETMYVKDDDEWQKEQNDKQRIKSVISNVISKNLELLTEYENKYPECMNPESKKSDEYNKIIMETMGGGGITGEKNKEKIIRKIAKEVVIEKVI
jgi:hypothetical protein